jgi:transcriptional regulator with XRE-family HTH domain
MVKVSPKIVEAIRKQRARGIRQYELAMKAEVHPSVLSALVKGAIPLQADDPRVLRLARVLRVPTREAFAEDIEADHQKTA